MYNARRCFAPARIIGSFSLALKTCRSVQADYFERTLCSLKTEQRIKFEGGLKRFLSKLLNQPSVDLLCKSTELIRFANLLKDKPSAY